MKFHILFLLMGLSSSVAAQTTSDFRVEAALRVTAQPHFEALRWRMIGPFRAGRTVGAAGVPSRPGLFYIGLNNGGVWKTDDFEHTWQPIFDRESTGSIGDLAVAPSNPDILYVGTGEGLHRADLAVGDGMFRSDDAGATWRFIGLPDAQQIAGIAVHPDDPERVFVAVLGHPYGPNAERGVYRTTDGGASWERVLYVNENTGAIQVLLDPVNPDIVYADLWAHQEGPWENAAWSGDTSGLYKSTDGGTTWNRLQGGLPTAEQGLGRIGIDVSRSDPSRVYATVDARNGGGIYRSDDAGESWTLMNTQRRLWGRGGDFGEIKVHPKNPDVVYVGNIASYRSDDGGRSWTSLKGAPGGDDYHRIWIHPDQPEIMLFAADQGATITVNGGRTWSSWYNQPTAQLYHVTTDNQFPYSVYGGQQESGAIAVSSRGDGGQISFRDWQGVGADEYTYVAPDPLNPDIVYGGRVVRFNKRTGQTQSVAPEAVRSGKYRIKRTMPLMFSPVDPHTLFFGTNVLWKTTTGGDGWEIISPDLSRPAPAVGESFGVYEGEPGRIGVIYALSPSPLDVNLIWAGTDDGLVHVTRDRGATWTDVTPPGVVSWDKISQIDAGHFDQGTAYVAVNAIRKDDLRPHIYRTHDFGVTWTEIVGGMPDRGSVNVVREDPRQTGLLYAGTETHVLVSFDDGDSWHSLRQNMPATSIRDLVVHDADLVVGTHGRSIWIMDGVAALRQQQAAASSAEGPYLVAPDDAVRVRWNMFSDTPLPPEEPTGENPPDGALIDYLLKAPAGRITLEIRDARGDLVRQFSSDDAVEALDSTRMPHPTYWIRPPETLGTSTGMHRFVWDLHHAPPADADRGYNIAAVYRKTPSEPIGPWVLPGRYSVHLSVDGVSSEQPLTVVMDPRVSATDEDIEAQHEAAMAAYGAYGLAGTARREIMAWRNRIAMTLDEAPSAARADWLRDYDARIAELSGRGAPGAADINYGSVTLARDGEEDLVGLQEKCLYLLTVFESADARPTRQGLAGLAAVQDILGGLQKRWVDLQAEWK